MVGRSGDVSALGATESDFGVTSFGCGDFEDSLRRSIDLLLSLSFGRPVSAGSFTVSSPIDPDLDIDNDFFFFEGEGERDTGLEKDGVQDRRFNLVAKEEALPMLGLAVAEFVVVVVLGVVDSALVSPGLRLESIRGSAASPFGAPSSANFCKTIFGLFRSWAAKSRPEPADELISRPSGVFHPDVSGGEAASSEALESTSVKLP